jgi:flagellar hook-associated protein 2
MDSINAISSSTGVTASIINDGSSTTPYHLILTGQDASSNFTVSSNLVDASSNPISFTTTTVQSAQQANLKIDGVDVVSNSNTITSAIPGVTLNLNSVSAMSGTDYVTSQLNITADTSTLETNITTFVTNYNAIINWINAGYTQASEAAATSSSSTTSTDPSTASDPTDAQLSQILIGDSTINDIKGKLQYILSGFVNTSSESGTLNNLSQIGITTNLDGTLSTDTAKLEDTLQKNFTGVTNLLAGDGSTTGVMEQFNTYLLDQISIMIGMYAQKKSVTQTTIANLEDQITNKTEALNKEEATLKAKFTAMETLISSLNSQSSFLSQWINGNSSSTSSSSSSSSSSS